MQEITITKATLSDIQTLTKIGGRTYAETYADCYYAKEMRAYYNHNFNEQATSKQLQDPNSQFFIAWQNSQAVGYVKVNTDKGQTELKEFNSLEIERLYVLAAYQGNQIGQLLCQKAAQIAKLHGKNSIWVKLWKQKIKGVRFCLRNGFITFDEEIFTAENQQHINLFMRKAL